MPAKRFAPALACAAALSTLPAAAGPSLGASAHPAALSRPAPATSAQQAGLIHLAGTCWKRSPSSPTAATAKASTLQAPWGRRLPPATPSARGRPSRRWWRWRVPSGSRRRDQRRSAVCGHRASGAGSAAGPVGLHASDPAVALYAGAGGTSRRHQRLAGGLAAACRVRQRTGCQLAGAARAAGGLRSHRKPGLSRALRRQGLGNCRQPRRPCSRLGAPFSRRFRTISPDLQGSRSWREPVTTEREPRPVPPQFAGVGSGVSVQMQAPRPCRCSSPAEKRIQALAGH